MCFSGGACQLLKVEPIQSGVIPQNAGETVDFRDPGPRLELGDFEVETARLVGASDARQGRRARNANGHLSSITSGICTTDWSPNEGLAAVFSGNLDHFPIMNKTSDKASLSVVLIIS